MRYWAFFTGKLIAALTLSYVLFLTLNRYWPKQQQFAYTYPPRFGHDLGYTLGVGLLFLLSSGMLYAAVLDQRYRCRICLRRLRMPIETGSWSRMLQLGRPEIEYICTYGHGRLNVPELQISGSENAAWTPHQDDIWKELAGAGGKEDRPN